MLGSVARAARLEVEVVLPFFSSVFISQLKYSNKFDNLNSIKLHIAVSDILRWYPGGTKYLAVYSLP